MVRGKFKDDTGNDVRSTKQKDDDKHCARLQVQFQKERLADWENEDGYVEGEFDAHHDDKEDTIVHA
jgi:hypothetical protein